MGSGPQRIITGGGPPQGYHGFVKVYKINSYRTDLGYVNEFSYFSRLLIRDVYERTTAFMTERSLTSILTPQALQQVFKQLLTVTQKPQGRQRQLQLKDRQYEEQSEDQGEEASEEESEEESEEDSEEEYKK